jgi:hypothetical protein
MRIVKMSDTRERRVYIADEDRWVTMHGTHILVDDKGTIKNKKLKDKIGGKDSGEEKKVD